MGAEPLASHLKGSWDLMPEPGEPPASTSIPQPWSQPGQAWSQRSSPAYIPERGTAVHPYLFQTPRKAGGSVIISAQSARISITPSPPSAGGLVSDQSPVLQPLRKRSGVAGEESRVLGCLPVPTVAK